MLKTFSSGLIELTLIMKYKRQGYYKCNTDCVNSIVEYSQVGYDTFCGYYDYFPLSKDGQYLLCQRVKSSHIQLDYIKSNTL